MHFSGVCSNSTEHMISGILYLVAGVFQELITSRRWFCLNLGNLLLPILSKTVVSLPNPSVIPHQYAASPYFPVFSAVRHGQMTGSWPTEYRKTLSVLRLSIKVLWALHLLHSAGWMQSRCQNHMWGELLKHDLAFCVSLWIFTVILGRAESLSEMEMTWAGAFGGLRKLSK